MMPENTATLTTYPVFTNGEAGIACYRIPSLVVMGNGELLALAEARVENCLDHGGPIRIVARTSSDQGQTWGPVVEVARNVLPDGTEQVAQNPCPVVDLTDPDHPEGKIVLMFNKAEHGERDITERRSVRRFFVVESTDHGRTWTNERDITEFVHRPNLPTYTAVYPDAAKRYAHPDDWRANFPPVGHAIQLRGGVSDRPETQGRLLFASYTTTGSRTILEGQVYLIWSDDHGETWNHTEPAPIVGINEMMATEMENGDILVNFRNYTGPDHKHRGMRGQLIFRVREDGTYDLPETYTELPELVVPGFGLQGSIIRYSWSDDEGKERNVLLFSCADNRHERAGMTVWMSKDEGQTWPMKRLIDPGPSAYSDLAALPDGRIALLYELGGEEGMQIATFTLDWLRSGRRS